MKTKTFLTVLALASSAAIFAAPAAKNLILNPSFEGKVNAKGVPASWGLDSAKAGSIVKNADGTHSFKLTGQFLRQIIFGSAFTPKTDKYFQITLKASGKGKLYISQAHFTTPVNEKGKKYNKFHNSTSVATFALTEKVTQYKADLKIPAGEFCQLLFRVDKNNQAILDDICVVEVPAPAVSAKAATPAPAAKK